MNVATLSGKRLLGYYLMASFLYYVHDVSVIPDTTFDHICKRLLDEFDSLVHPHKHLVTKDDLEAGTGYRLTPEVCPLRLQSAAWHWYRSEGNT